MCGVDWWGKRQHAYWGVDTFVTQRAWGELNVLEVMDPWCALERGINNTLCHKSVSLNLLIIRFFIDRY